MSAIPGIPGKCETISARNCTKTRSEEHTSELQSRRDLVCRLLLEKKIGLGSRSESHTIELHSRRALACRLHIYIHTPQHTTGPTLSPTTTRFLTSARV